MDQVYQWIEEIGSLCNPSQIEICDGSLEEYHQLIEILVKKGTLLALKRPNSYLARSDPSDVARVESRTFICCQNQIDAGPTNNWIDPNEMKETLNSLMRDCMKGRTLYVVPFVMGPLNSQYSKAGVQFTDSEYVVVTLHKMVRVVSLDDILQYGSLIKCVHTVGCPLKKKQKDVSWPCNSLKYISHFPEELSVISYGSGYGGNSILPKKSFSLRLGSYLGKKEKWLAEHMLILGITNPNGQKKYFTAAFPSACGKTNLAMIAPKLDGWKISTFGDDIAWLHRGDDGQFYAINPENGFFGVAPGTNYRSNPNAMKTIETDTIFTNVALTPDGDVWWEGMTEIPPPHLIDWQGKDWTPECGRLAAHPNSRFTASLINCPILDPNYNNPDGVPISGILFGGRRMKNIPLVRESKSWVETVYFGASVSSEQTAAAEGVVGTLRRDPFAMLPFCGYNMADYFQHWLDMGSSSTHSPKGFMVNWFRKGPDGKFLWPGYCENMRVLKWIFDRCNDQESDLDIHGLNLSNDVINELLKIDPEIMKLEHQNFCEYLSQFGDRSPQILYHIYE